MGTRSRLVSRATAYQGQAARAMVAHAQLSAATALSFGVMAAREAARCNSYPDPTDVLSAIDAGDGTATIQTADHVRVYPVQGTIDVPDLALASVPDATGAALGVEVWVYYDDPTLENPAPTIQWTYNAAEAQVGYALGRHFLGVVTTPTAGSPPTTGTGGHPPGYNGGAIP